jgi:predicted dithiol-disulfide oxidoreductase (DUF899 family)
MGRANYAGSHVRGAWASELMFADRDEGEDPRHVDSIWPIWNVLDMTPAGRANSGRIPAGHYD